MEYIPIKPMLDRILVLPTEVDTITKSGLYIPENAKEQSVEGTVIAVASGYKNSNGDRIKLDLNVGDKILYEKYVGTELKYNDKTYLIMHESQVIAIIEENK